MRRLRLVPATGHPIEVTKDLSAIGRDPSCELVVTDGSVSRRHARIERRGSSWWVVDQGSANGTYINSRKVSEEVLGSGQELRFGALAFRVELEEDPEATVATPIDDRPPAPGRAAEPPLPPSVPPRATPSARPAPAAPRSAAHPPAPPSAAAAQERFRPAGAPASPVPQMGAGAPPPKKGRSPLFWVAAGCCGCLLLVVALIGVIAGGVYVASKGPADAAHAWLGEVRQNRMDEASAGLSSEYRGRLGSEELQALASAIQRSKDATFYSRSIDNDKAVLRGVLSGEGPRQPITIHLVKEGGAWKVDDVRLGVE